jgi:hypothetical protein
MRKTIKYKRCITVIAIAMCQHQASVTEASGKGCESCTNVDKLSIAGVSEHNFTLFRLSEGLYI